MKTLFIILFSVIFLAGYSQEINHDTTKIDTTQQFIVYKSDINLVKTSVIKTYIYESSAIKTKQTIMPIEKKE